MALLARRNIFHDRIRFAVTLTLGFTTTTSNNIDHSRPDLWLVFHGVGHFDTGRMFSDRRKY